MASHSYATHTDPSAEDDFNLVELWLRRDPVRWISGALGGLFSGVIALLLAMVVSIIGGAEFWFPLKLIGTILIGNSATETGFHLVPIVVGLVAFEALCAFLGVVFSHFVPTNRLAPLAAMGLVWGVFSWIFIWNLFLPSFNTILAANVPAGAAFPVCLVFGLGLVSISFFDQLLRSGRQ